MLIGSIGKRVNERNAPPPLKFDYRPNPLNNGRQKGYGENALAPPPVKENEQVRMLQTPKMEKEKKEYVIGDTKEEIIHNIIKETPSVSNLRKAFTAYADIIMDEDIF